MTPLLAQQQHSARRVGTVCMLLASLQIVLAYEDISLQWAQVRWYNPSLVESGKTLLSSAKATSFRRTQGKTWWVNELHICRGPVGAGVHHLSCSVFQPWGKHEYHECEWDFRVRHGKLDTEGLGDVKLWRWPGRGVFAIFGRKPALSAPAAQAAKAAVRVSVRGNRPVQGAVVDGGSPSGSRFCGGPVVYQQFLALVQAETPALLAEHDANWAQTWRFNVPLPLTVDGDLDLGRPPLTGPPAPGSPAAIAAVKGNARLHKGSVPPPPPLYMEKNWMPFIFLDHSHGGSSRAAEELLLVTYSVQPHRVVQIHPDGRVVPRWATHNTTLFAKFATFDVHGGPAIMNVPAEHAAGGQPYNVGIMHHIERFNGGAEVGLIRVYRHFAFRFATTPPFAIDAISDELPLTFMNAGKRTRWVTFVSGLDLSPSGLVRISYGAADAQARLLSMSVQELEALFSGEVRFNNYNIPYPVWAKA